MFVDVKLAYVRSMLRRMPKRKAVASIGSTPRAVLLHILLHILLPNPPKTPQICVILCAVSC
jgi:hypothetical protein